MNGVLDLPGIVLLWIELTVHESTSKGWVTMKIHVSALKVDRSISDRETAYVWHAPFGHVF